MDAIQGGVWVKRFYLRVGGLAGEVADDLVYGVVQKGRQSQPSPGPEPAAPLSEEPCPWDGG